MKNNTPTSPDFALQPFLTRVWVSDRAYEIWSPRFKPLSLAILETTMEGIRQGRWDCRTLVVPGWLYLKAISRAPEYGICCTAHFLGNKTLKGPSFYKLVLSKEKNTDLPTPGIPPCCQPYNKDIDMENYDDSTWDTAFRTPGNTLDGSVLEIPGENLSAPLWHNMGISLFAHRLCSFHCASTRSLVADHIQFMAVEGYDAEAHFLEDILSWPVEWSSLHGICELSTPIVKLACNAPVSHNKRVVQLQGSTYPEEGAYGQKFPFRKRSFLKISDSKSFRRGLENINQKDNDD